MNSSLRGITWDHIRGYGPLQASIDPYAEECGILVNWDKRSLKDFGDASLEALARKYDLIIMDHPHCGTAMATQTMVPLETVLRREVIDDAWTNSIGPSFKSYWYEGHLWALPIDAACQVASFRSDLFPYTLPQRWDDVFYLAEDLKRKKQFIAMALCATDCNCSFLTLCAQGGDAFRQNELIGEETAVWALDILRKFYTLCHPESIHWNPIKLYDHMATMNDVVYCPLAFGYSNYSRPGFAANELRFGSIPGQRDALLGGAGIAISKYCENITEAAAYATWICSDLFQTKIYVEAGGQPAHRKAWMNDHVNLITGNFFADTLSTIQQAHVRPRNASWPLFQEALGEIIFSFLKDNKTVSHTWNEIRDCYRTFFRDV